MDMVRAKEGAALLQADAKSAEHEDEEGDDSGDDNNTMAEDPTTTTTTTKGIPTPPVPKDRVVKRLDVRIAGIKCPTEPPDCGLLHDNMSLMWGKFKDLVDELQAEMDKNLFEFTMLKGNLNQQLEIL